MTLPLKDKTVQFRIEPELWARFSRFAEQEGVTSSLLLRRTIVQYVDYMDKLELQRNRRAIKDAEYAATLQSRAQAARAPEASRSVVGRDVSPLVQKPAVDPSDASEGYLLPRQSRSDRRKAEREAEKEAKRNR